MQFYFPVLNVCSFSLLYPGVAYLQVVFMSITADSTSVLKETLYHIPTKTPQELCYKGITTV